MAGYRFCRSDDIPLLVAAHNACWVPHFGPESALTVDDFKLGIRELGFWSSSCMVAFDGDEPIGILIGAKRDRDANCVQRLAIKPGYERRGHGRHLLTSLADKAAILGPPRLVAELPAEWTAMRRFFEKSGFEEEATYGDFTLATTGAASGQNDPRVALVIPITLDELIESGAIDPGRRRAWSRSVASLRARAAEIEGWAVATDRVEAFVLIRPSRIDEGADVIAIGAEDDGEQGRSLLALLVARIGAGGRPLRIPMIADSDVRFATLAALGFRRDHETIGYVARRAG
ncbi:MAG: GNAT family N-acetyltransferase [Candidatus Binatia bacterium]